MHFFLLKSLVFSKQEIIHQTKERFYICVLYKWKDKSICKPATTSFLLPIIMSTLLRELAERMVWLVSLYVCCWGYIRRRAPRRKSSSSGSWLDSIYQGEYWDRRFLLLFLSAVFSFYNVQICTFEHHTSSTISISFADVFCLLIQKRKKWNKYGRGLMAMNCTTETTICILCFHHFSREKWER